MNILVINGPNLNLLGKRDKTHYGSLTLEKIEDLLKNEFSKVNFIFYQSNVEGEIINKLQESVKKGKTDGIMINPGGYAHTSVAIRDALTEIKLPKVEVHLSHIANRDDFRQVLITASACNGYISGFKETSYTAAVFILQKLIKS